MDYYLPAFTGGSRLGNFLGDKHLHRGFRDAGRPTERDVLVEVGLRVYVHVPVLRVRYTDFHTNLQN
jgi:hypothetical protein